ncbi:hypothetical protein HIM_03042 [Hirsutella minnesotensis 3608]|nr:hypothetical protein HIM_03042 [Hirsutella minnesotensis 3608]
MSSAKSSTCRGFSFTKVLHHTPYPAISPSRPELSQVGKTILITGGSAGIGFAIARAFSKAGAEQVIIVGRRVMILERAALQLRAEYPKVKITSHVCDIGNPGLVERLWKKLEKDQVFVDVVVLNAVKYPIAKPIVTLELHNAWDDFTTNVRGHLDFAQRLYKQPNATGRVRALVNVSTIAIYEFSGLAAMIPNYSATKNAGAMLLQMIAKDVRPEEMQVVSFHPGAVFTQAAEKAGLKKDHYDWDDENMAGQFAVWAASPEARFLHGRFVWAGWDVEELCDKKGALRKRIEEDPYFLKIGVSGLREWETMR